MSVCAYDNPITMNRECWQNGKMICHYSCNILRPYSDKPFPRDLFFFGANTGNWEPGKLIGDKNAMNNWIKLTDKKPCKSDTNSGYFWIWNEKKPYEYPCIAEAWIGMDNVFKGFCDDSGIFESVSHWMTIELPECPVRANNETDS